MHLQQLALTARESWLPEKPAMCPDSFRLIRQPEFAGADIKSQTRQSLTNIKAILAEAGMTMDNVVKTTVLLSNIADFVPMNEVYAEFFEGDCPARAAFQAAAIPKGALVEIEAIAVK